MTHDYVRHGTTSLFAAYDLASGSVIAQPYRRHRHQEFLRFLKLIDAAVPKDLDLHLVLDNYATHKTPGDQGPGCSSTRGFTCTSRPRARRWLNLVERWFAEDSPAHPGPAAPDPAAYGLRSPPLFQPLTVLRGRGRIFPAPSRGTPHPELGRSRHARCVPMSWSTGGHHGYSPGNHPTPEPGLTYVSRDVEET